MIDLTLSPNASGELALYSQQFVENYEDYLQPQESHKDITQIVLWDDFRPG